MPPVTRRAFLSTSSKVAAASAMISGLRLRAADSPNEAVNIALIGCGGVMNSHVQRIVEQRFPVRFLYLCDVDPAQIGRISEKLGAFQPQSPKHTSRYEEVLDDRKVDAVIVATPHHWHVPIGLRALAAGKDLYVEKPVSHVFQEGRLMVEAARQHGRVVQHGTQMRSSKVIEAAGQLLRDGVIGEVKIAKAWNVQNRGVDQPVADSDPPVGADYDRWLGPAPSRKFNQHHWHSSWRNFRAYGNGDIGDDGIHDIDLACWGLGVNSHPVRVTAHGSTIKLVGDREYPDNMMVTCQYPDGKVLIYEDRLFTPYGLHGFDSGNAFYGTEGYMIFSRRGYFQVYLGPKEEKGPGVPSEIRGNAGRGYEEHMANFLDAIKTRKPTNAPMDVAHHSCAVVHLGEVAYRTSSVLDFDPAAERITNNDAANALLTKEYRAPYTLPESV